MFCFILVDIPRARAEVAGDQSFKAQGKIQKLLLVVVAANGKNTP